MSARKQCLDYLVLLCGVLIAWSWNDATHAQTIADDNPVGRVIGVSCLAKAGGENQECQSTSQHSYVKLFTNKHPDGWLVTGGEHLRFGDRLVIARARLVYSICGAGLQAIQATSDYPLVASVSERCSPQLDRGRRIEYESQEAFELAFQKQLEEAEERGFATTAEVVSGSVKIYGDLELAEDVDSIVAVAIGSNSVVYNDLKARSEGVLNKIGTIYPNGTVVEVEIPSNVIGAANIAGSGIMIIENTGELVSSNDGCPAISDGRSAVGQSTGPSVVAESKGVVGVGGPSNVNEQEDCIPEQSNSIIID